MDGNKKLSGTTGMVWVNGETFANVKSFEAKVSAEYEEVKIAGEYGTDSKYMGYSIEGTIALHKIDSQVAKIISDGFLTGKIPEIILVSGIDDPAAKGVEKVQIDGVKFTEMTLQKWEVGQAIDEEVPFKGRKYKYLEMI